MKMKKIYIGADSAGYTLKEYLKAHLNDAGYKVVDMGTDSELFINTNTLKNIYQKF